MTDYLDTEKFKVVTCQIKPATGTGRLRRERGVVVLGNSSKLGPGLGKFMQCDIIVELIAAQGDTRTYDIVASGCTIEQILEVAAACANNDLDKAEELVAALAPYSRRQM